MRTSAVTLAALFASSEAATTKLYTQNSSKRTIKYVSARPATGAAYSMEIPLSDGVDYITQTITYYDTVCNWSYLAPEATAPRVIAKDLGYCDYPTRKVTSTTMTMTMPIAGIPEFDMEGATLIVDCQMTSTRFSRTTYDCDRIANDDTPVHHKFFDFYDEPKGSAAGGLMDWIVLGQSIFNVGILGASPCLTSLSDMFDTYYYSASEVHSFNEIGLEEGLLLASSLGNLFNDGYYCYRSLEADQFWNTESNFWYLLFNDGFDWKWNSAPDNVYLISYLTQIAGSVLLMMESPNFLRLEIPRLVSGFQK